MKAYKHNDVSLILSYFEPQGRHESLQKTCMFQWFPYISSPRGAMKACKNNDSSLILLYFEPQGCHKSLWKQRFVIDFLIFRAPGVPWKLINWFYYISSPRGAMKAYENNEFSLTFLYLSPRGAMKAYKSNDFICIFCFEPQGCKESLYK